MHDACDPTSLLSSLLLLRTKTPTSRCGRSNEGRGNFRLSPRMIDSGDYLEILKGINLSSLESSASRANAGELLRLYVY